MKIPLKDTSVKALNPDGKRYIAWFKNLPGFGVRVTASGKKTFIYKYNFEGTARMYTIGRYPEPFSLKKAVKDYKDKVGLVANGADPAKAKQKQKRIHKSTPTVSEFILDDYIERYAKKKKRTWKEDKRHLEKDVIPAIGDLKITKVTKRDIVHIIDGAVDRGANIGANRLLACVRKVFNYAVERAELDFSPALGVKSPSQEKVRDRILSNEEIKTFWKALDDEKFTPCITDALKLLLVTAKRKGEAVKAKWEHIDFVKRIWHIPVENAKNKVAHNIPLNDLAVEILLQRKEAVEGSDYLFPPVLIRNSPHLGETTIDHFMRKNLEILGLATRATPHDLRRTALTILAERKVRPDIRQKILNHTDGSIMGQHYDKYDYLPEMRVAMDKLNKHIVDILDGEKKKADIVSIG